MAWMNQEKKAELVAQAKAALPSDWKVSFSVRHHSTLVATILQAPASVLDDYTGDKGSRPYVNHYHLEHGWKGETLKTLEALRAAMMTGNHDRSDIQTDYFDVGWYVEISFGRWNKPCDFVSERLAELERPL